MMTQLMLGKRDRAMITGVICLVLIFWIVLAFMPLIALRSGFFTAKNVERVKS